MNNIVRASVRMIYIYIHIVEIASVRLTQKKSKFQMRFEANNVEQ